MPNFENVLDECFGRQTASTVCNCRHGDDTLLHLQLLCAENPLLNHMRPQAFSHFISSLISPFFPL